MGLIKKYKQGNKITDSDKGFLNFALDKLYGDKDSKIDKNRVSEALNKYDPSNPQSLNSEYSDEELNWIQKANEEYKKFPVYKGSDAMEGFLNDKSLKTDHYLSDDKFLNYLADNHYGTKELESTLAELNKEGKAEQFIVDNFHKYLDNMKVDKRNIADVHKYKDYDLATTVDRNLDFRKLSSWLEHKTDGRLNLGSYTWTDDQKEQYRLEREADAKKRQQDAENEQNALDYGYYVDNLKNMGIDEESSKFLWDNKFNRKTDYSDYFNEYLKNNNLHVFTNDAGLNIVWGKAQDGATGLYTNKQYDNDYGKVFKIGSSFQDNPNFRPLSISDYNEETFGPANQLIGYDTLPIEEYESQVGSMDFNFNNKPDFLKDYQIRGTSGDNHRGSYERDIFGMRNYMANLKLNKLTTDVEGIGDNAVSVPVRGEDIELKRNSDGSYTFNGNTFRLSDFSYGDFNQDKLDSGYFLNNKMYDWWDRVDGKKPSTSFLDSLTVQYTNPEERFKTELDKVNKQISGDFEELKKSQKSNTNPDIAEKKLKKSLSEFKYIFEHSYGKYGASVDKMLIDLWNSSNRLLNASTPEGENVFKKISARKKGGILYAQQGNSLSEAIRANRDLAKPVNNTQQTTESAEPQLSGNTYKANVDGTGTVKESGVLDWISLGGSLASFVPVFGGFGGLVSTGAEAVRDLQDGWDGKAWGNLAANLGFTALSFAGLGAAKAGQAFKTGRAIVKSGKTAKALKGLNQTGKASKQLKLLGKSEQATKLSSLVSNVNEGKSTLGVKNIASYVDKLEDTTKGVNEVAKAFKLGSVKNKAELVEKLSKQASIIEGLNKPITLSQSIGHGIKTAPVRAARALMDHKSTIGKVVKTGLVGQAGVKGAVGAFTIGKNIADEGSISKGLSKTQMSDLRSVLQAGMLGTQAGVNRYRQNILFKNLDHTGGHQKITVGKSVNVKGKQSSIGKETLTFKNNTNFDQFKEMSVSKPDDIKKVTETLKKQLVNPNSVSDKDLKAFAKRLMTSGISKQTTVGGKYGLKELSKDATPKEIAQHERARRWVEDTGFEYYSIPKWYRDRVLKSGPMVNSTPASNVNITNTGKVVNNISASKIREIFNNRNFKVPTTPNLNIPKQYRPTQQRVNFKPNKYSLRPFPQTTPKNPNKNLAKSLKRLNKQMVIKRTTDGKGQLVIPGFEKLVKNRLGGVLKARQGLSFTNPYLTKPKYTNAYNAYNSLYRSNKPILKDRDLNLPDLYTGKRSIKGFSMNTRFPTFNYGLKDITGSYRSFDYNEKPKSTNYWEVPVSNTMSYLNTRNTNKQVRDLARSAINAGISKIDTVDAPTLRVSDYSQGYVDKINHQTNSVLNRALKNTSDIGKTVQGIKDFTNTQNQALQDVYAQGQQRVDQLRSQNNSIVAQNESNRSQALNQNRASAADAASRIFMNEANYKAMQNESFKEFLGGMTTEFEKNRERKALDEITGQYSSDNYRNMQYNTKVYLENQKAIQKEIEEMNRINGTDIDYKTDSRYLQNEEDYKRNQQPFSTWLSDLNNKISLQKIRSSYNNPQKQTASKKKGGRLTVQERAYLEKIKYENKRSLDAQKLFYKQMQESNKELQKRLLKIFD